MTVNTIIETDRVCDVAILQEAWRGRCAEPERYHSVVCQVFRDVRVSLCRSLLLKMLKRTRWKAVTRLRSAWRTAETTASAGGHGMRNDDKTHGPGARGAGAVYNWLRRHAGCNVLAEVSHIELSHVRTVVFSGRQRQRSFHDRRRARFISLSMLKSVAVTLCSSSATHCSCIEPASTAAARALTPFCR